MIWPYTQICIIKNQICIIKYHQQHMGNRVKTGDRHSTAHYATRA